MLEIFDDIRKLYTFSRPCEELKHCIEFYSESSAEETNRHIGNECFTVKMFPSFTPTIYINLGEPYYLSLADRRYFINAADDVLIIRDTVVERHNLPSDHIFTIKFFPGGLEAVFGINQVVLTHKAVNATNIIPPALIAQMRAASSFEERMQLVQNFLLLHYNHKKKRSHYLQFVQQAIDAYNATGMLHNNNQLAEKMFTTSKTLNRYFNTVIGATPKHYFSILRARASLTAYVSDRKKFDPANHGYYDMSHFYKDVIKFTGQKLVEHRG
jgi:hypothetical protein